MKLGSLYDNADAGTPTLEELKNDVADVPMGSCSWADYAGKVTVEECMKALEEYSGNEDDEEADDEDAALQTTDRGWFKKTWKKVKKFGKKVGKAVKKVKKFCSKNGRFCRKVVEIGKEIISGNGAQVNRRYPTHPQYRGFGDRGNDGWYGYSQY